MATREVSLPLQSSQQCRSQVTGPGRGGASSRWKQKSHNAGQLLPSPTWNHKSQMSTAPRPSNSAQLRTAFLPLAAWVGGWEGVLCFPLAFADCIKAQPDSSFRAGRCASPAVGPASALGRGQSLQGEERNKGGAAPGFPTSCLPQLSLSHGQCQLLSPPPWSFCSWPWASVEY